MFFRCICRNSLQELILAVPGLENTALTKAAAVSKAAEYVSSLRKRNSELSVMVDKVKPESGRGGRTCPYIILNFCRCGCWLFLGQLQQANKVKIPEKEKEESTPPEDLVTVEIISSEFKVKVINKIYLYLLLFPWSVVRANEV